MAQQNNDSPFRPNPLPNPLSAPTQPAPPIPDFTPNELIYTLLNQGEAHASRLERIINAQIDLHRKPAPQPPRDVLGELLANTIQALAPVAMPAVVQWLASLEQKASEQERAEAERAAKIEESAKEMHREVRKANAEADVAAARPATPGAEVDVNEVRPQTQDFVVGHGG